MGHGATFSWKKSSLVSLNLSVSFYQFLPSLLTHLFSTFHWHIAPISDRSFDRSLLCNTASGKLHLCKCHTERKDQAGIQPQALQGHANSMAPGSLCLDEVPKAF